MPMMQTNDAPEKITVAEMPKESSDLFSEDTETAGGYVNWMDGLERYQSGSRKGEPKQTIENALYALEYCPKLAGLFRYNEFSASIEVRGANWKRFSNRVSDTDYAFLYYILEKAGIRSKENINSAVMISANENSYHPVREYLESLKWDKKDHISNLFPDFLGAKRCEYTTLITKIMFGGIISRTEKPGEKFDTAIVLVDTAQGGGKSTMCRLLALNDEWYCSLRSVDDQKAAVETITGHLIVELEEMEGLITAKSIETVRSFLSRRADTYRTPYDKFSRDIQRGSICIGTSNDPNFLPMDRAGNRRFLPIRCDKKQAKYHPLDNEEFTRKEILQSYAQAMHLYKEGKLPTVLPKEWDEELEKQQKDFTPEDTKANKIEQWITGIGETGVDNGADQHFICVPMIYQKALGNAGLPKQWESKEIAAILDGLKDDQGNKLLMRYENSGGIHRFNEEGFAYGRCRAWVRASEQKTSQ